MKWVSNLPDSEHTPYPFIAAEPHFKSLVSYMRPSDYVLWGTVTAAGPGALLLWGTFFCSFQKNACLLP